MILDFRTLSLAHLQIGTLIWPRSTMDSIRASEAPDAGSIPAEATKFLQKKKQALTDACFFMDELNY